MSGSILSRYLLVQTARGLLTALTAVLVLILLVDFVEQIRTVDVRTDGVSLLDFAGLTLLKTPMLVETTLPFIVLFGVMFTMFQLNRRSELVVMRAAGIPVWRFIAPALGLAIVLGLLSPLALNPFAAAMAQRFQEARAEISGQTETSRRQGSIWLREVSPDGLRLIRADSVNRADLELRGVTFLLFDTPPDAQPVFARRIDAAAARLAGGLWLLEDAAELVPGRPDMTLGRAALPAWIDLTGIGRDANVDTIPFWRLPTAITAAAAAGESALPYRLRWLRLLSTPILMAAMALIACAASLRLLRLGGALRRVILAGVAGFSLYFSSNMLAAFALGERLPPLLAAGAAPIVALLAALALIAWMEDA